MRRVNVRRRGDRLMLLTGAHWCESFWCRLRGLQFRSHLKAGEALLLAEPRESRAATSIHMLFVFFPIAVVWINTAGRVVDKVEARPWRPYYASRAPAQYTLETEPVFLNRIEIGDEVDFEPA